MKKSIKDYIMLRVFLFSAILAFSVVVVFMAKSNPKKHFGDLYKVWIKANPKHQNLNFEEWNTLRKFSLLPNSGSDK